MPPPSGRRFPRHAGVSTSTAGLIATCSVPASRGVVADSDWAEGQVFPRGRNGHHGHDAPQAASCGKVVVKVLPLSEVEHCKRIVKWGNLIAPQWLTVRQVCRSRCSASAVSREHVKSPMLADPWNPSSTEVRVWACTVGALAIWEDWDLSLAGGRPRTRLFEDRRRSKLPTPRPISPRSIPHSRRRCVQQISRRLGAGIRRGFRAGSRQRQPAHQTRALVSPSFGQAPGGILNKMRGAAVLLLVARTNPPLRGRPTLGLAGCLSPLISNVKYPKRREMCPVGSHSIFFA